jgi:hypothetical protein
VRITLAIIGAVACATGVGFIIAAAALWLSIHYGPLTSDVVMGVVLFVLGGLIIGVLFAGRDRRSLDQPSAPEQVFENLSAVDLRGLALIFESRPVLASALALMLGLEKGLRKTGRRAS